MQRSFLLTALACTLFAELTSHYFSVIIQADEVEAVLANTKQILSQFVRKSGIHSEHDLKHIWIGKFSYSTLLSF